MAFKYFNQAIELKQFFELEDIHTKEAEAGYYWLDANLACYDLQAIEKSLPHLEKYINELENTLYSYFDTEEFIDFVNNNEKAAFFGSVPGVKFKGQEIEDYYRYILWHQKEKTVVEGQTEAVRELKQREFSLSKSQFEGQKDVANSNFEVLVGKLNSLIEKSQWEDKNAIFKRQRTVVARNFMDLKAKNANSPDGILNYKERLDPLFDLIQNDFNMAIPRLKAAEIGLKSIFGYYEALPSYQNDCHKYFDKCLVWNRTALNWINKFSKRDQFFVVPISVRSLLTNKQWKDGINSREFSFVIEEKIFFDGYYHVRLKGISGFVFGLKEHELNGIIQAEVQIPKKSYVRHSNVTDGIPLDQSQIPVCRLSRIATRDFIRAPEVAGSYWLNNISPFSANPSDKWVVKISTPYDKKSPKFEDQDFHDLISSYKTKIKDLFIDLHVVAQTQ